MTQLKDKPSRLAHRLTSWGCERRFTSNELTYGHSFDDQDAIATEVQQQEHPDWQKCVDGLLAGWSRASDTSDDDCPRASRSAIESALQCILLIKKTLPHSPPTYVAPDPNGGVIVERRTKDSRGNEHIWEVLFSDDDTIELTVYLNGKVTEMTAL